MQIKDKVALVVGGARGIGQAYCQALLEKGAKVKYYMISFTTRGWNIAYIH